MKYSNETGRQMTTGLMGYTGFVGSTLLRQTRFDRLYRSTDVKKIDGQEFDCLVCAAAPAQKWIAKKHPAADRENIGLLVERLARVTCRKFVLISTVDVFKNPVAVDEDSDADDPMNGPYGLHRRGLERFVEQNFSDHLIVRLPGLVGPGLRKNIIYDIRHGNNTPAIDSRGIFQFYPMINLWFDIKTALQNELKLVHLTAEPVCVEDLSENAFGRPFVNVTENIPAAYDMRSKYASIFGGTGVYQYSRRETFQAIRAYAQADAS